MCYKMPSLDNIARASLVAISCLCLITNSHALRCLETVHSSNGTADSQASVQTDNQFCAVAGLVDPATGHMPFEHFGLRSEQDSVEAYERVFQLSMEPMFSVLSLCVLERYELMAEPEYLLRCVCKSDDCNSGLNIDTFMKVQIVNQQTRQKS